MKHTPKTLTILLLIASMLTSMLAGCGGGETTGDPADTGEQAPVETETQRIYADDIADDVKFDGQSVKFMWWAENNEFSEELSGEVVNDAKFERDLSVETRLNIDIVNVGESYTWDTKDIYLDKIRTSVMANDGAYDVASGQYATLPGLVGEGIFMDMTSLNYLDFTKPYWVQQLIEETSINGKLYLASGDLTNRTIEQVWCILANDTMRENLGLEDPVDLVHAGTWTKDVMNTMINGVYQDTDGDQTKSAGDTFGLLIGDANCTFPFLNAFEISYTTLNEEGYPELTFYNEKTIEAWEFLMNWCFTIPDAVYGGEGRQYFDVGSAFEEGRALFTVASFGNVKGCVEYMEDSFAILPMPKWDEQQAGYYTWLGESNTLFGIVTSVSDKDATAAALEMMAAESYRLVSPAIYEINMKTRYAADSEMSQMFDLIREGVVFNFGLAYGFAMNQMNTFWKGQISQNGNLSSGWASQEKGYKAAIDKFYENVEALDQ
ncbi:MAG: hypothetical protein E7631_07970 [Ruminococcaceae bacterium]|nr:hypothetical protein [Oscillospiraceae bacterium]